jgi:hypothetical protein
MAGLSMAEVWRGTYSKESKAIVAETQQECALGTEAGAQACVVNE